ncbi:MAG: hypothetical protein AAGJ87_10305, partial [Pseudomonadota bacterium]
HFQPWRNGGGRMDVEIRINAPASAFGEKINPGDALLSPFDHPAFVYFGDAAFAATTNANFLAAETTPAWIVDDLRRNVGVLIDTLADRFGAPLDRAPDVFLAYQRGGPYGLLRYSGDALPGQMHIALAGGGWKERTGLGESLLQEAIAHEAVHLWQAGTRPAKEDTPSWIHEGAAEMIAVEALIDAGLRSPDAAARRVARAEGDCASELRNGSLASAERRGAIRAVYACGAALMKAMAIAHNERGSVSELWTDFAARADVADGYDRDLLYDFAGEIGGDEFARAFRAFETARYARPDRRLRTLADLAREGP